MIRIISILACVLLIAVANYAQIGDVQEDTIYFAADTVDNVPYWQLVTLRPSTGSSSIGPRMDSAQFVSFLQGQANNLMETLKQGYEVTTKKDLLFRDFGFYDDKIQEITGQRYDQISIDLLSGVERGVWVLRQGGVDSYFTASINNNNVTNFVEVTALDDTTPVPSGDTFNIYGLANGFFRAQTGIFASSLDFVLHSVQRSTNQLVIRFRSVDTTMWLAQVR